MDTWKRARLGNCRMCLFSEDSAYNYASIRGSNAIRWTVPELVNPGQFGLTSNRPTFESNVYTFGMTVIEVLCYLGYRHAFSDCLWSRYTRVKNLSTSSIRHRFENAS